MSKKNMWTEYDEKKLAKLINDGFSLPEIAADLGRSHYSVISRASLMGYSLNGGEIKTEWTEEECDILLSLARKGHSIEHISTHFKGISINSILKKAKDLGSPINSERAKIKPKYDFYFNMPKVDNPVPFANIKHGQCRYCHYYQDGFCGQPVYAREMCKDHYNLCYTKEGGA